MSRPSDHQQACDSLMITCRHCKHSLSRLVAGVPVLMCLFWRRVATQACAEFEREPGADDEL